VQLDADEANPTAVEVRLIAPPLLALSYSCAHGATGVKRLNNVIAAAAHEMAKHQGGELMIQQAPVAVQGSDMDKGRAECLTLLEREEEEEE